MGVSLHDLSFPEEAPGQSCTPSLSFHIFPCSPWRGLEGPVLLSRESHRDPVLGSLC